MSNELARDVKKYKRQIKSNLLCGTKLSKQFLSDLSDSIDNYIEENNITQLADVQKHFGSPEQIAQSFLSETDIRVIRKKVKLKQIILLALIVSLLIWGIGVALSTRASYDAGGGYIIDDSPVIISQNTEKNVA